LAQHVHAAHVGQIEVQQDQVVVVDLAEIDALFAEVRRIDVESLGLEHQLDALRGCAVVFDQQYAHSIPPDEDGQAEVERGESARVPKLRLGEQVLKL